MGLQSDPDRRQQPTYRTVADVLCAVLPKLNLQRRVPPRLPPAGDHPSSGARAHITPRHATPPSGRRVMMPAREPMLANGQK